MWISMVLLAMDTWNQRRTGRGLRGAILTLCIAASFCHNRLPSLRLCADAHCGSLYSGWGWERNTSHMLVPLLCWIH